jgi:hypothetical protein
MSAASIIAGTDPSVASAVAEAATSPSFFVLRQPQSLPSMEPAKYRQRPRDMMPTSRIRTSAVLAGIAAVALGGCAVVPAPATGTSHPATASAKAVSASTRTPKQRAEADIASILKRFTPPPGAHRVSTSPASLLNALPDASAGEPNYVRGTEWWLAPGNPEQVLAWEAKHVSLPYGTGRPYGMGTLARDVWDDDFALPDVTGVLFDRQLSVATTPVGRGQTGIEVTARDQWIPTRPASEVIPSAARVVTLTLTGTFNNKTVKEPKPVTVTDPAKVRRIAALLDALPLTPTGAYGCPAGRGDGALTLAFKAGAAATALAVVTANLTGCAFINLTINGKQQPGIGPGDGGLTLAAEAFKVVGLSWKIPGNPV